MMRARDATEAVWNAVLGLAVSWALVAGLRYANLWDAPALLVSAFFFVASVARSYTIRRAFRIVERLK